MKTLLALVIAIALLSIIASGYAGTVSGINIISESHTMDLWLYNYAGISHMTQSTPLDYTYSDDSYYVYSHAGNFHIQGGFSSAIQPPADFHLEMSMISTYYFVPLVPHIQMNVDWAGGSFVLSLVDTVSSQTLLNTSGSTPGLFPANLTLDTSRMYKLNFGEDTVGGSHGGVQRDVTITPEPATLLLLGLGGLCLMRKRKSA